MDKGFQDWWEKFLESSKPHRTEREVILQAVQILQSPEDIRTFYDIYVSYLKTNGRSEQIRQSPEAQADRDLHYSLKIFPSEVLDAWKEAIPSLESVVETHSYPGSDKEKSLGLSWQV